MKKLILVLTIISITLATHSGLIIGTYADDVYEITLEEAQKRALDNNTKYKYQDTLNNKALENYFDTEESVKKQYGQPSKSFIDYFNKPITLEMNLENAYKQIKAGKFEKENIKRTSDLNVYTAFINIEKARIQLDNAKNNTQIKKSEYQSAQDKYKMGLIKASQLSDAEKAYKSAVDSETNALKNLQQQYQVLNRLIGRELTNYDIYPVIDLSAVDIDSIDLDKLRKDYIKNRQDLFNLEMNVYLAQRKYDLTKERYDEFAVRLKVQNSRDQMEEAYDNAEMEYENARKAFEDATIELDFELKNKYDSLKDMLDEIDDLQEEIDQVKADIEKTKLLQEMKLATAMNLKKAEYELSTLQNNLKSKLADLNLKYYEMMIYSEK